MSKWTAVDVSFSGYITTQGRRLLDRETNKEHELEVTISDRGEPRLSTPVLVIVTVTDTNDNPPVFKQPIYNFNVPSSDGDDKGGRVALCRFVTLFFPSSLINFLRSFNGSCFAACLRRTPTKASTPASIIILRTGTVTSKSMKKAN